MTLYDKVENIWSKKHEELAAKWAAGLTGGIPLIEKRSKEFREWSPLRFYVSVTDVTNAGQQRNPFVRFSLRYRGQEVASVEGDPLAVEVEEHHCARNKKYWS